MKLDLFAQQHRVLEDMPTTSLTLATFLRALVWSASRGFDVWSLQESWLGARAGLEDLAVEGQRRVDVDYGHGLRDHPGARVRGGRGAVDHGGGALP